MISDLLRGLMRPEESNWRCYDADDLTVVYGCGEIDLASAPALRSALLQPVERSRVRLVLDLTAVTFLDAAGLGVLVDVNGRVRAAGGFLHLVTSGGSVRRVLEITCLDQEFRIFETIDEALSLLTTAGLTTTDPVLGGAT